MSSESKKPKARKSVKKPSVKKKSAKKPIKKQTKTKEKKPVEIAKPSVEPQVEPTIIPQELEKPPTPTLPSNKKNPMKVNPLFIIIGVSVVAAGISVALFMVMSENAEQLLLLEEQERVKIQQQRDLEIKQLELEAQELDAEKKQLQLQGEMRQQDLVAEKKQLQLQEEMRQQELAAEKQEHELQKTIRLEREEAERQEQRQQAEIERQEIFRQQQQEEYEAEIKQEKLTQLEILAATNPLLKKIMTGHITFWVQPVPYYAGLGVAYEVDRLLDAFASWSGVSRVYNEGSADIRIQWIKEFSPHQGGQYWQSYAQVGLGQTACKGKWQPFTAHTVRQVMWHEIGHAMGHGHSNDPNNVMWGSGLEKYFDKEYVDDLFLEDGSYSWRSFCRGGEYTFSLEGSSKSNGFKFWVITPETDARKFINDNEGLHYPSCNEKGLWTSYTSTCNIAKGSYLLVHNPRDDGNAINVDVKTQYTGGKKAYSMTWDPATLKESKHYLVYLDSLR